MRTVGIRRYAHDRPTAVALGLIRLVFPGERYLKTTFKIENSRNLDAELIYAGDGKPGYFRRTLHSVVAGHIDILVECDRTAIEDTGFTSIADKNGMIVKDDGRIVHRRRYDQTFTSVPLATGGYMDEQVLSSLDLPCPVCHAPADQDCNFNHRAS